MISLQAFKYFTIAVWTGLEPATSCVTGRHSNQLNYQTNFDSFPKRSANIALASFSPKFTSK